MWRKEDGNPQSPEVSNQTPAGKQASPSTAVPGKAPACVSQGIRIKGELTGSEDLFIDGTVDGKVTLTNSALTVGPNAAVKADIVARELVVRGRAEGKFTASERVQIWHTARVEGELKSQRISIEDGAELRGQVEAGKVSKAAAAEVSNQNKKTDSTKAAHANKATDAATAGAD